MPSASTAQVVKQASTEAPDPLKQAIKIIENKIRNLEKRKTRLDGYRELQQNGKELQAEQLEAIKGLDEVDCTLTFARDLNKQFNSISAETAKQAKKLARKEALERNNEIKNSIKEVLLLQNVLNQIGTDPARDDFLNGRNGAVKLEASDLQLFDTFYETVMPKVYEEATSPIEEQLATAAEHFHLTANGSTKEFSGKTYAALKELLHSVHSCGYFDKPAPKTADEAAATQGPQETEQKAEPEQRSDVAPVPDESIVRSSTFQAAQGAVPPPQMAPHIVGQQQQPPAPSSQQQVASEGTSFFASTAAPAAPAPAPGYPEVHQQTVPIRPHDVISSVSSGNFNFLQDSELDSPDITVAGATTHQLGAPIPTQTYTNQNFATSPVNPPPASAVPMYHPPQPHLHVAPVPPPPIPMPPSHQANAPILGVPQQLYNPQGDNFDQPRARADDMNEAESADSSSQAVQPQQPAGGSGDWNMDNEWRPIGGEWHEPDSEWSNQQNDSGYQTQRSGGRDRGDRDNRNRGGKGRGSYNGFGGGNRGRNSDRGGYQGDRQGCYGGYRNNEGGSGNYYQNGYKDGQGQGGGGYRGRGPREGGGDRSRPSRGGTDRGGPRGRGSSRGRGGYRGHGGGGAGGPGPGAAPKQ